jgi:Zn-dependent metalloprotease
MRSVSARSCTVAFSFTLLLAFSAQAFAQPANQRAIERAVAFIRDNPAAVRGGPGQAYQVRDVILDADGSAHVRFDRTFRGLRVLGGDFVVHHDGAGSFRGVSMTLGQAPAVSIRATLDVAEASAIASEAFGAGGSVAAAELVIEATGAPALAYDVVVTGRTADGTPSERHFLVHAHSGAILDSWDAIQTTATAGTGWGFFDGIVTLTVNSAGSGFELLDPTRGSQSTTDMNNGTSGLGTLFTDSDPDFGDGTLGNRASVAVDAQYGAQVTWDYFEELHGRTGIRNDGVGALSRVHYGNDYNNAFWSDSCFCMTYGDGDGVVFNPFPSLDVAGHEMVHGVTSATAKLRYSGESGGLNEATSDIFGTMVEFRADNAQDPPDYDIGERLFKAGGAIRYMYRPSKDGASRDCYSKTLKALDVHYSSGVANHFFYLLAEGSGPGLYTDATGSPTCDGSNLVGKGIGRSDAERIWYRALTVYMTSRTTYAGARTATLNAAADLFGAGSAQQNAVATAWKAVNVK